MKRILRTNVYRVQCPYCDCEFEYEVTDIIFKKLIITEKKIPFVECPNCNKELYHKSSIQTATSGIYEDTMST